MFIFSLAVKIYDIRKPDRYYFDEIYFAFTANEMAQWHKAGWRYVPGAPKGVAYEWTHPPLGKEITAIGIKIFGNNPVGWRIFQVLFGAAGTIIIYFLVTELFRNKLAGLFASVIYTFESMTFVLSRISMVDIYLVTFMQLSLLFLLRFINYKKLKSLAASGFFIGCAISVKWNGIFGLFFLCAITLLYLSYTQESFKIPVIKPGFIRIKNPVSTILLFLIILPLFIYFLTYIPFLLTGNSFHDLLILQRSMYYYHKNLHATHPYSSLWWQWPVMLKPVFMYLKPVGNNASFIYAIGNPFIWWTGSLFTVAGLIYSLVRRNLGVLLAVMGLLAFWVPWIISPRALTFIYHFFPSVTFMIIITAYFLSLLWQRAGYFRYLVCIYLLVAVITFCYFYPITSGYPVAKKNIDSYMWIKSWR